MYANLTVKSTELEGQNSTCDVGESRGRREGAREHLMLNLLNDMGI